MEGEIEGLLQSNNGRSSNVHQACGKSLNVGEIVAFQSTIVEINDDFSENAFKAVMIRNGRAVGFLSRQVAHSLAGIDCLDKRGILLCA